MNTHALSRAQMPGGCAGKQVGTFKYHQYVPVLSTQRCFPGQHEIPGSRGLRVVYGEVSVVETWRRKRDLSPTLGARSTRCRGQGSQAAGIASVASWRHAGAADVIRSPWLKRQYRGERRDTQGRPFPFRVRHPRPNSDSRAEEDGGRNEGPQEAQGRRPRRAAPCARGGPEAGPAATRPRQRRPSPMASAKCAETAARWAAVAPEAEAENGRGAPMAEQAPASGGPKTRSDGAASAARRQGGRCGGAVAAHAGGRVRQLPGRRMRPEGRRVQRSVGGRGGLRGERGRAGLGRAAPRPREGGARRARA